MTDRAEWLASLKVGDTVGVLDRQRRRRGWIAVVTHRTPTGQICVSREGHRMRFTPGGDEKPEPRGDSGSQLETVETVTAHNQRADDRADFVAEVERLYLARHGGSRGCDFAAHTTTIRGVTAVILGVKP